MAWYVDPNGRQVWVDEAETVYTVTAAADDLPFHALTYLAVKTKQRCYETHIVDEPLEKGKKDAVGKTRGFIVRVDNPDDDCNVISCFQEAARKLLASGVVSRIDADEAPNERRKKKKGQKKAAEGQKEEPVDESGEKEEVKQVIDLSTLADNEIRVVTMARCSHQAHGPGFRVEIAEGGSSHRQVNHMFTDKKEVPLSDWFDHLSVAIRSTGHRVMDCRVPAALIPTDAKGHTLEGGVAGAKKKVEEEAQGEENDWLSSMMGLNVSDAPKKEKRAQKATNDDEEGGKAKTDQADLPPWLRTRTRRSKASEAT